MKKTGLFFGSFNPIHAGHMIIAQTMLNYGLDEIWFVVSPHNPHKEKKTLLNDLQRLYMARVAVEDNSRFYVSDIETKLDQPSYTVNTLAHLREKYPEKDFALIMGYDNLLTLHKWKNPDEIVKHHKIYVYSREVKEPTEGENKFLLHENVVQVETPLLHISSTKIREMIKEEKDIRYLVTEPVYKYITEMNLYK